MKKLFTVLFLLGLGLHRVSAQPVPYLITPSAKIKNIVLLIGDGMGLSQITAGMTANKGYLNLERMPYIGLSKTQSGDAYITDSGAGGTALSIGHKTYDHAIGVDLDTIARTTILEYAHQHEKSTGIVVSCEITHATPAAFYAHVPSRYDYEDIAMDLVKNQVDVFFGGGRKYFTQRKDQKDFLQQLKNSGYLIIDTINRIEEAKNANKIAGLLYLNSPPKYSEGRGDMLEDATQVALQSLSQNPKGFFLMIEGSQIDWGGHDNDTKYITDEVLDFDRTLGIVLDFAKKNRQTLVIVTADHETGGMGLNNGNMHTGEVDTSYTTGHHTGVMVPVFAMGPGAAAFAGIYENTALFYKMMNAFGFQVQSASE